MKHESDCNKGGKGYLFSQLYAHGTEQQVLSMSNGAQNSLLWAQLAFTSPQELPPGPLNLRKVLMICSWPVTEERLYYPLQLFPQQQQKAAVGSSYGLLHCTCAPVQGFQQKARKGGGADTMKAQWKPDSSNPRNAEPVIRQFYSTFRIHNQVRLS